MKRKSLRKRLTWRKNSILRRPDTFLVTILMVILILLVAGCTADEEGSQGGLSPETTGTAEAEQLSEQAENYITMARLALAEEYGADAGAIELESITEPAAEDDTYIIVLSFDGQTFEYHGRDGEVNLVSNPLPRATDMVAEPTDAPIVTELALVEEVSIRVDADADDPIQVNVSGQLRNSCEEIHEITAEMVNETTFNIEITVQKPEDAVCAEVLTPYEQTIVLGEASGISIDELVAGDYMVVVNDELTDTFVWPEQPADEMTMENLSIELIVDETVYTSQFSQTIAAVDGTNGEPFWDIYPDHAALTLEGYVDENSIYEPQIFVYPVEALSTVNDAAGVEIETLQEILANQPDLAEMETLPYQPLNGESQLFVARPEYMTFADGNGIRYLTYYGQTEEPVTNQALLYTFQGLTSDGAYYVAAVLPVSHPDLPVDAESETTESIDDYVSYLAETADQLNQADAASFTPNLETLDAIVTSISIEEERGSDTSEVPDAMTYTEADLVSSLEEAGATVRLSTEQIAAVDILSIPGHVIFVNGEELQLYLYDTVEAAMIDAERISADGSEIAPESVGDAAPTIVDWDGQPHFYRWGNILLLYVGEDDDILSLLETTMGEPFAGSMTE